MSREETAWFEQLYAAAETGDAQVPWFRGGPNPFLEQWVRERAPEGAGRRALVIGTALGDDAEMLAGLGYAVTAFDIAPTAIERARRRFPDSDVDYRVADLLDLPCRVARGVRPRRRGDHGAVAAGRAARAGDRCDRLDGGAGRDAGRGLGDPGRARGRETARRGR